MTISIHAPRTGSDSAWAVAYRAGTHFNPRSPHGERLPDSARLPRQAEFQSTLPARGATSAGCVPSRHNAISIHAPRTGSDLMRADEKCGNRTEISIHAPRTGSDFAAAFQPRAGNISIHAPRTGSDVSPDGFMAGVAHFNPRSPHGERHRCLPTRRGIAHFNPRSPHGERPIVYYSVSFNAAFQSTLPARGATKGWYTMTQATLISIHAPRTGSDPSSYS